MPMSPRRADAHHGQAAQNAANRSDIRSQSYLVAKPSLHYCNTRDRVVILKPNSQVRRRRSNNRRAELDALSTAARPPASVRGALPVGRPWITLRCTLIQTTQQNHFGEAVGRLLKIRGKPLDHLEESIYDLRGKACAAGRCTGLLRYACFFELCWGHNNASIRSP